MEGLNGVNKEKIKEIFSPDLLILRLVLTKQVEILDKSSKDQHIFLKMHLNFLLKVLIKYVIIFVFWCIFI